MDKLGQFRKEMAAELNRIMDYWEKNSPDTTKGGFIGRVDHNGKRYPEAEKSCVLNSRILWTFSAASQILNRPACRKMADRAFDYFRRYFYDQSNGGTYWSLKADGTKSDDRKQVYAQAFSIYGLSEYYACSQEAEALALAIEIYEKLEEYSYEPEYGGYIEAFTRNWEAIDDMRLGGGGMNAPKTMNTHLHVIEAFVNLYLVWPDFRLRRSILGLLDVFEKHIIDSQSNQMILYSSMDWKPLSQAQSFGHDIEASWLLLESAEVLHQEELTKKWKEISVKMINATDLGLAPDKTLYYEFDPVTGHWNKLRSWWVLNESVVGYLNAWQITRDERYLEQMYANWDFTKKYILDRKGGEWFSGVNDDYKVVNGDKIGFWKGPYHNGRMCMEVMKRIV